MAPDATCMTNWMNTVGLNIYKASEWLDFCIARWIPNHWTTREAPRITWLLNIEKGVNVSVTTKKVEKRKIWFLFRLKTSQNEFHNCREKSLHRYHWKHQLDYISSHWGCVSAEQTRNSVGNGCWFSLLASNQSTACPSWWPKIPVRQDWYRWRTRAIWRYSDATEPKPLVLQYRQWGHWQLCPRTTRIGPLCAR